ncbi:hypothetical protein H5410_044824 [Solanum commersonii]|uniref:CCHC-type domain-containing protein n=1 Tax=Solanum commersonii TaxID=4109 RepID=A0A9J5XAT4_SOLCO|nr:hypothetical protein H5410_044824 [Solanum commersonii]
MYYYPRPTPQDILLEEQEYYVSNSFSGIEIYEWNIDGFTDRQIYTLAHRIFMYSMICKANKNSEKDTANVIIARFTGQLKGWWGNYLSESLRMSILNALKDEIGMIPNVVYNLVLTIIEHFSGRWSDNSEAIRTMLQNLRCKTLTSFRWYNDVFLSRVMELTECNTSHWISKWVSINYDDYTYGKLIRACTQEGLSLCNEIKLNQQIKIYHLNEKQQLGEFCEQFPIDMPESSKKSNKHRGKRDYKEKPHRQYRKNKRLDKREKKDYKGKKEFYKNNKSNACHKCGIIGHYERDCKRIILRISLYKILLNSSSENSSPNNSDGEESSTSEDLKVLHEGDYMSSSEEECTSCQIGQPCDNKDKDEFYQ